jgi:hypothetical protein
LPSSTINPQVNETTAPYQFDAGVTISGANISGGTTALSPGNVALKGWSFPLTFAVSSAAPTTGSVYVSQITLPVATTLANVYFYQNTAAGIGTTTSFVGLYYASTSSTAALVASSAAIGTATVSSTPGFKAVPFTTPFTTAATGSYYVAMVWGGTGPTIQTGSALSSQGAIAAGPVPSSSAYPFAVNGTGQTSLPVTLTLASASSTVPAYWLGVA